ncbi:hypothetical protein HT031_003332 [Scenedesmus sp. PABB004]|nr:hypothetical protein HT031_003332 [Scenedesmus sp. PABB004]
MDWQFNGWGDLYGTYEQDKLVAAKVCESLRLPYVSTDFVLEGGSIHVDGEGGLYGDEDTNGHVDNFACFAAPGVVLLAWADDPDDPQTAISAEALALLEGETDARGRKLQVIKLPCPPPLHRTQEEWETLDAEGRKHRHAGERLAASYVNFYVANGGVVMPAFGEPAADDAAAAVLARAFPGRRVVAVQTREIVLGGGNIHCITQQQPRAPGAPSA